jgi:hypothetical protein
MNTSHRIRFSGTLQSRRRRPGLLTWLVLAAILLVAAFIPVVGLVALVLFVAFYLPAALGSFMGWLVGGARDEVRTAWRVFRRRV